MSIDKTVGGILKQCDTCSKYRDADDMYPEDSDKCWLCIRRPHLIKTRRARSLERAEQKFPRQNLGAIQKKSRTYDRPEYNQSYEPNYKPKRKVPETEAEREFKAIQKKAQQLMTAKEIGPHEAVDMVARARKELGL